MCRLDTGNMCGLSVGQTMLRYCTNSGVVVLLCDGFALHAVPCVQSLCWRLGEWSKRRQGNLLLCKVIIDHY